MEVRIRVQRLAHRGSLGGDSGGDFGHGMGRPGRGTRPPEFGVRMATLTQARGEISRVLSGVLALVGS